MKFIPSIELVPDHIVDECWKWGQGADAISGDHYKEERGQSNPVIRQRQFMEGKIAEWAVYQLLIGKGMDVTEPEMFARRPTKHDADLVCESKGYNFHIKSCKEIRQGSRSWVFEKRNPIITSPLDNDFLCLCSTLDTNKIRIDTIKYARYFIGHYKPMINDLPTKCAIYGRDFPEIQALDFPEKKIESDEILGF